MRMIERHIFFYAVLTQASAIILAAIGVTQLEVFYSIFTIEFLVLLELLTPFKRSLAGRMGNVAVSLFAGFVYIVALRVISILK